MNLYSLCCQPLTELSSKKCKRCGFYEEDSFKSDDVYEEWEFCPSDFSGPDGKYIQFKDKEFNATFLCPKCVPFANGEFLLNSLRSILLQFLLLLHILCAILWDSSRSNLEPLYIPWKLSSLSRSCFFFFFFCATGCLGTKSSRISGKQFFVP